MVRTTSLMIQKFLFILIATILFGCKTENTIHQHEAHHESLVETIESPQLAAAKIPSTDIIIHRLNNLIKSAELHNQFSFNNNELIWLTTDSAEYHFNIDSLLAITPNERLSFLNTIFKNTISFPSYPSLNPEHKTFPLKGLKIAIDPGHSAGDLETAKIEGKYIEFFKENNPDFKNNLSLIESELTFQTAIILKKKLEAQGAEVLLTRNKVDQSAMGYSFQQWHSTYFQKHIDSLLSIKEIDEEQYNYYVKHKKRNTDYNQKILFNKLFNTLDFYTRAQKINTFAPHLTLILHYNVDVKNDPWIKPTNQNKSMGFVPGGFMNGELKTTEDQFHFARLLFSDQQELSIDFTNHIIQSIEKEAKVAPALETDSIDYLVKYCNPTPYKGVYTRNLALTRMLNGVICYAEPLYQDNKDECYLLQEKNVLVDDFYTNKRVETIANAYYNGIVNFLTKYQNK